MEQQFVNRISETEYITKLIEQKNRVNIIFSNEGFGKTILIEHLLKQIDKNMYININTDDLLSNNPCDFYFIKKIISAINEQLSFNSSIRSKSKKIWDNNKSNLSLSLNLGPIGIGFSVPQDYKIYIDDLIKNTREINKNIYIHIENIQKIDYTSLYYIMRIINETDNIFFFLECSNNIDFCNKIQEIFQKNMISINISISKLEWSHVSLILRNLNMLV